MSINCVNCIHWAMGPGRTERHFEGAALRECHANPPIVISDRDGRFRSMFPMTREDDWCDLGEDDQS